MLQQQLDHLHQFCLEKGMEVNVGKTEVVVSGILRFLMVVGHGSGSTMVSLSPEQKSSST